MRGTGGFVLAMALLSGATAGADELRMTAGIADSTATSTGISWTGNVTYRFAPGQWRIVPAVEWSSVAKEYVAGGSGNWTGSLQVARVFGRGRRQPFLGAGWSYTYTDSATWTKRVAYAHGRVGLRQYSRTNRIRPPGPRMWRDYMDVILTGSCELSSTYANETRGIQVGFSFNEHVGNGWFLVTEAGLGVIRYHPNPYDASWQHSGTLRVSLGMMRSR